MAFRLWGSGQCYMKFPKYRILICMCKSDFPCRLDKKSKCVNCINKSNNTITCRLFSQIKLGIPSAPILLHDKRSVPCYNTRCPEFWYTPAWALIKIIYIKSKLLRTVNVKSIKNLAYVQALKTGLYLHFKQIICKREDSCRL